MDRKPVIIDGVEYTPAHGENLKALRDYFAGQVLQGWAANGQVLVTMKDKGHFDSMANWSYQVSDAMLEARGNQSSA